MKKFVTGAVTAGALMAGAISCSNPEVEPQPQVTSTARPAVTSTESSIVVSQEVIEYHHKKAEDLRLKRLEGFNAEMNSDGLAQASYDNGNCVTFTLPQTDAIVSNPVQLGSSNADASVNFYLYVQPGESGPQLYAGPYTYFSSEFGGMALSDVETWSMNDVSNPELVPVVGVETNGQTSWLVAKDKAGNPTVHISETVLVPHQNGVSDVDTLAVVSAQLCGEPAEVIPSKP